MKKALIAVLVIIGIAGIVKLASFKNSPHLQTSNTSASTAANQGSGSSGSGSSGSGATSPSKLKDGTYNGQVEQTQFGPVQVSIKVASGKITTVNFPQMPTAHAYSQMISQQISPILSKEIIKSQSTNFNLISGATFTSMAVAQSLQTAL